MFHYMPNVIVSQNNHFVTAYPRIYSVADVSGSSTAGTGQSSLAKTSALGEHLERYVFRNLSSCIPATRNTTGELCNEWDWADILSQLAGRMVKKEEARALKVIRTWCPASRKACFVPDILVSLEGLPAHELFPSADTTGCAVHTDPLKCSDNAVLEFCERQCAFASWFGPWPSAEVLPGDKTLERLRAISGRGRIKLFDIGQPLSIPVVLSIFQSDDDTDPVQFAAGLGAAWSRTDAIKKSVNELYQLYELTYFSAVGAIPDANTLLPHNTTKSANLWPFTATEESNPVTEEYYVAAETTRGFNLVERLETIGIRLLLFVGHVSMPGANLYAAKALSPDAFLSSMGKSHNNYNNRFARTCALRSDKSRPCILF